MLNLQIATTEGMTVGAAVEVGMAAMAVVITVAATTKEMIRAAEVEVILAAIKISIEGTVAVVGAGIVKTRMVRAEVTEVVATVEVAADMDKVTVPVGMVSLTDHMDHNKVMETMAHIIMEATIRLVIDLPVNGAVSNNNSMVHITKVKALHNPDGEPVVSGLVIITTAEVVVMEPVAVAITVLEVEGIVIK